MKRIMSIAAIALFMVGSSVFACDTCGCKAKKADDDACCSSSKKAEAKKCGSDCAKACCAKKSK